MSPGQKFWLFFLCTNFTHVLKNVHHFFKSVIFFHPARRATEQPWRATDPGSSCWTLVASNRGCDVQGESRLSRAIGRHCIARLKHLRTIFEKSTKKLKTQIVYKFVNIFWKLKHFSKFWTFLHFLYISWKLWTVFKIPIFFEKVNFFWNSEYFIKTWTNFLNIKKL